VIAIALWDDVCASKRMVCTWNNSLRLFWLQMPTLIELILIALCLLRFCDEYVCERPRMCLLRLIDLLTGMNICAAELVFGRLESLICRCRRLFGTIKTSPLFHPHPRLTLAPPQLQMSCGNKYFIDLLVNIWMNLYSFPVLPTREQLEIHEIQDDVLSLCQ
jgi:hypothetical protein